MYPRRKLQDHRLPQRGLTLVELMVAVAIAAVLAAVAVPAYLDSMRRARRADAITALQQAMLLQERYRANSPQYATHLLVSGTALAGVGTADAAGAATAYDLASGMYSVSLSDASATGYLLQAQAKGGQAADSPCQVLQLRIDGGQVMQASGRTAAVDNDATANRACWGS
jgi:type IV pilus assembly protein PilE